MAAAGSSLALPTLSHFRGPLKMGKGRQRQTRLVVVVSVSKLSGLTTEEVRNFMVLAVGQQERYSGVYWIIHLNHYW